MSLIDQLFPKGFDFKKPEDGYTQVYAARIKLYKFLGGDDNAEDLKQAHIHYSTHPVDWIEDFCITIDPRLAVSKVLPSKMPFILFPRQRELIEWLYWLLKNSEDSLAESDGLCEKTRDCGLSWLCVVFAVWIWIYYPSANTGFGSLKADSVDSKGNPKSLLEKVRIVIRNLPGFMIPHGYDENKDALKNKIINRTNGATIVGESGPKIGRSDRYLIFFKDESAHYEQAENIEAALGRSSECKIDISSVNGPGNLFYTKRHSLPEENIFIFPWEADPRKTKAWFGREKKKHEDAGIYHLFAQEVLRDYSAAVSGLFIPAKWVQAAIDYPLEAKGKIRVALDVADETMDGDTNAMGSRQGNVVSMDIREWGGEDTAYSANEFFLHCLELGAHEAVFDRIGVGAGVHSEMKKLDKLGQINFDVHGFVANAVVFNEWDEYAEGVTNGELFENAKAQATWNVRRRCEKCYKNLYEGASYHDDELISLPNHPKMIMEMSRPKRVPGNKAKIMVESKKSMSKRGLKSPNILDMVVMLYAEIDFNKELRLVV